MRIRFPHIFFSLMLSLFVLHHAVAQGPPLKKYELSEKNRNTQFNCFLSAKTGYIYAGSTAGLYRFNGYGFNLVTGTSAKDSITAIAEDRHKNIWLGLQNGQVGKLVHNAVAYIKPEEGMPKKPVSSICFDTENQLWFSVPGEGIYYLSGERLYLVNEADGLTDLNITRLYNIQNQVLAASDQGFYVLSAKGEKKKVKNISPKNGLPDYIVTCFEKTSGGHVLIGLQDKGFCLYDLSTAQIQVPASAANWGWGEVSAIKYLDGKIWIGARDQGLIRIDDVNTAKPELLYTESQINALAMDGEENIWALKKDGLFKSGGNKLKWLPVYNKEEYETIHAVLKTGKNTIWSGTDGGIIEFTNQQGSWQKRIIRIAGITDKTDITSLCTDAFGNIWLATMGRGVIVVNPATGRYRNITENPLLINASLLSVSSTGNTVCAGGLEGVATIFELNDQNRDINATYAYTNYNNIQNIGNNYIYTVFKDSRNRIWFGTNATGITVLQNGSFTNYNEKTGLAARNVLAFTEDKKGQIWFCTEVDGIYKFDGKTFTHFTDEHGLSSMNNTSIRCDANGNIIVAHQKGFDVLNTATGSVHYVNQAQGLSSLSIDIGTVAATPEGEVMFTAPEGFVIYKSPSEKANSGPVTRLESVLLHLKEHDTTGRRSFSYDQNSFTFNFAGLWYTQPDAVQYQYKLEGYDSNWVFTNDRSKSFAQLEPGDYTFRVRSSLSNNFSGASEATYRFTIVKAFWKQWWFILLCALLSAALIYWYVQSREKEIRKMQQLENEKIGFQFQVLRNQVNPHFLFNSFNTLISTIEEDPKMAVDYVEYLSDFFRNIVNYRDKDLISLQEELEVLQTYVYLQQKRYGANLQVEVTATDKQQREILVPPLTLQLLVENAIKHNAVSATRPLVIHVQAREEGIVLTNNINPKSTVEKSSGMGLQNISNRYELLCEKKVIVNKTENQFSITLPVIKK